MWQISHYHPSLWKSLKSDGVSSYNTWCAASHRSTLPCNVLPSSKHCWYCHSNLSPATTQAAPDRNSIYSPSHLVWQPQLGVNRGREELHHPLCRRVSSLFYQIVFNTGPYTRFEKKSSSEDWLSSLDGLIPPIAWDAEMGSLLLEDLKYIRTERRWRL